MRAGAELVWSDGVLRKIWLEDMVRVSFDALEKVAVSSTELFGDEGQISRLRYKGPISAKLALKKNIKILKCYKF